jgi:hypothetical protein
MERQCAEDFQIGSTRRGDVAIRTTRRREVDVRVAAWNAPDRHKTFAAIFTSGTSRTSNLHERSV